MKKRLLFFLSRYRAPCLCLLSGLLLSLFAAQHEGRLFSPDTAPTLPRGNYGAEDARYALVVEGSPTKKPNSCFRSARAAIVRKNSLSPPRPVWKNFRSPS